MVDVPNIKAKDFKLVFRGTTNKNNMSNLELGTLPNIITDNHVTNNVIKNGAKIFLPRHTVAYKKTPLRNKPYIDSGDSHTR